MNRVYVVGVGMAKFEWPSGRERRDHPATAGEAGASAIADAGATASYLAVRAIRSGRAGRVLALGGSGAVVTADRPVRRSGRRGGEA